jgi:hypothetical protein
LEKSLLSWDLRLFQIIYLLTSIDFHRNDIGDAPFNFSLSWDLWLSNIDAQITIVSLSRHADGAQRIKGTRG